MIKLHNTLSGLAEEFKPINDTKVNFYCCGPTVYNDIYLESLYEYARKEKSKNIDKLIDEEALADGAKYFIEKSLSKGYVEYAGDELDGILPPTSRRRGQREKKKAEVLAKISALVDIFVEI